VASTQIVQLMVPEPYVDAELTTKEIHLCSVISILVFRIHVELMQIVQTVDKELFANVDQTMLETHLAHVVLNPAPPTHVVSMLTALLLAAMLYASASQITLEIPTPTAILIHAPQVHVAREQSVTTTEEPQCASVHPNTSETLMSAADLTPAREMPVVQMLIVPGVVTEQFVLASEDILEVRIPGPDVVPTPVLREFVVAELSARMLEEDLSVNVCLATMETPTPDALLASVMKTPIVDLRELAKITNVLTLVNYPVDRELIALCKTMWLFAGVQEGQPVIHSEIAEDLPGMKFVLLVVPTQTVRLDLMIGQFADVKQLTLEIPFRDVDMSVKETMNVVQPKNVTDSTTDVRMLAAEELVVRMQIVRL